MNALQKLANGMSGKDAIAKAWATCPSKVSVKHPDGASVKTGCKAGASAKDIADSIVLAAATIKRGDGLSLSRKLASTKPDVTGGQSAELDKLDSQSHAAITLDFAEAFGASDEACEEAHGKIVARTAAFEKELQKATKKGISEAMAQNRLKVAFKLMDQVDASDCSELFEMIEATNWTDESEGDATIAAIRSAIPVVV